MTSRDSDLQEPAADEGERRLFELLDRYLNALHRGDHEEAGRLLEGTPELKALGECLDSLDSLAPSPPTVVDTRSRDDESLADETVFGKYELLGEIGRGGMGIVYRARQRDLERIVALKMIRSSQFASEEEVRRFHIEARAAGKLRHPHIVGIHEVGEHAGQPYFTMDCVEGRSLAGRLADGPFDPESAAELLVPVARAVHYLHENGVVHRDLKPGNILLDAEGNPCVTDFGLAKLFAADGGETRTGTIIGTPSYMAPEQAAGRTSEVSPKSDVYSLGAILYEMLTGRPPFRETNPLDTLVQVIEGEPLPPRRLFPRLPRSLELICLRCLEKDGSRRYGSAAELADDLERFLRGEPVEARPSGPWDRLRRWARREPALASHLAGLSVAAGVVQATYMVQGADFAYHLRVMTLLCGWGVVSAGFQWMLRRPELAEAARFGWAAADAALLTAMLWIVQGPVGSLLIGYPLLVVASGMFFRVRLVWFMTCAALLSYGVLVWLRPPSEEQPHYPAIFAGTLAVLGFAVAYQVHRVRALSRYYERRRL